MKYWRSAEVAVVSGWNLSLSLSIVIFKNISATGLMAEREEDVYERKESKKDKGYVAFRSDDDSVGEEEEEESR